MDIMQLLFNTNHETPSGWALQGTAVSAIMKAEIYDVRCLLCSWIRCLC